MSITSWVNHFSQRISKTEPMAVIAANAMPQDVGFFHHLMPYRFYDENTGIFYNYHRKKTAFGSKQINGLGFGFRFEPLTGSSLDLIQSINEIICSKLPTGKAYSYQLCLTGNRKLGRQIAMNQHIHSQRGGMYADLAKIQAEHARKAIFDGFPSGYGKHARFDLKNYESWLFVSALHHDVKKMSQIKEDIEIDLAMAQIQLRPIDPTDLIEFSSDILVHDTQTLNPTKITYNPYDHLNQQIFTKADIQINKITPKYIDVDFAGNKNTRLICLSLQRLPQEFFANDLPDLLASTQSLGLSFKTPFLWSVNFQSEDKVKAVMQAKKKIKSINKLKQMQLERFLPFLNEELTDYLEIEHGLEDERYRLCNFSMDIVLFSSKATWKQDRAAVMNLFKKSSLQLNPCQYLQGQILQSVFPFCYGILSQDRQKSGTRHRVKSTNIANFLPMVADFKGAIDTNKQSEFYAERYGLLTPTAHNQLAYLSAFFMGQDSYNIVIAGAMGSGKSVLAQCIIYQIVAMGGYCWAIDKGFSYKTLCLMLDGKQIDATTLFLNPFSFLDLNAMRQDPDLMSDPNIDVDAIFANSISAITELYYMMGKPDDNYMDPFAYEFLSECILAAYGKHKTNTLVDHVVGEIQTAVDADAAKGEKDHRKSDWLMLLAKYMTGGINGKVFNEKSQLDPDVPFICIEMEGIPKKLKKPVMLALTIDIDNRIILSSKGQPKAFVCEEVSQTMNFESKALEAKFSEGAATYRKKNATLITITQLVAEYFKTHLLSVIYEKAALKIVMSQDAKFGSFAKKDKDDPLFTDAEIKAVRNFRPSSEAHFSSFLLKKYDGSSSEHRYFLDPFSKILTTTKSEETARIRAYQKQGLSLDEAITKTVADFYGEEMQALAEFSAKFQEAADAED